MKCNFTGNPEKCAIHNVNISCRDCLEAGCNETAELLAEKYETLKMSWLNFSNWFLSQGGLNLSFKTRQDFVNIKYFINELFGFEKFTGLKDDVSVAGLLKFYYVNQILKEALAEDIEDAKNIN